MATSSITAFSSPPGSPPPVHGAAAADDVDAIRLGRLSAHLDCLLDPVFFDCADAELVLGAGGDAVPAHRCILAARSPVFLRHFSSLPAAAAAAGEKTRVKLAELVPGGSHIGRDALVSVLGYMYTARLKMPPREAVVCVDDGCLHEACRPAIDFIVESTYAASGFQISELLSLFQRTLSGFVNIASNEDMVQIIRVALTLRSWKFDAPHFLTNQTLSFLDDAFAVHYAATHCTPKVVSELLKLDSANVNLKNSNGYTPLHMACIRLEPGIVLSLIEKGASVLEWTPDGHDALTICKRLTREKDLNKKLEKGQERSCAYLCIDILEQTKRTHTSYGVYEEEKVVTPLLVDNFHMNLIYLENRVAFARIFFPSEANLAMYIAEADSTEEFIGTTLSKLKEVGLSEMPTMENRRLRERLDALSKTVELGRRYFPNCSAVLDKFLNESTDLTSLESDTPEDRQVKRMRFYELKEDVRKALDKDNAALATVASTASSSSSPRYEGRGKRQQHFRKGTKAR